MSKILQNIFEKKIRIKEKNGKYTQKNGAKKQKYRMRAIHFDSVFSAYHSRHFDGSKSVNPHFHFLFLSTSRMGKSFTYLKQAIADEAREYRLKFNFMEPKRETGLTKKQLRRIESFSWLLQQGEQKKIKKYLSNISRVTLTIELLKIHYQNTQNLSFFLKILSLANQRMRELQIDCLYQGTNLRKSIFFYLTEEQKSPLRLLKIGEKIILNLSNILDREILKYAHGFQSEVMFILVRKFTIADIKLSQLSYHHSSTKSTRHSPSKSFRKLVVRDLRDALAYEKN
jgi:hypothetical protein